ncbi:MAG: type II toxin-antitoxin system HicA family toxin [Patescibacteria group bacterium]
MPRLPDRTPKQVMRILESRGFQLDHTTGSHYVYYHPQTGYRVTVPFHHRSLPKGTLATILKQSGISRDEM